MSRASTDTIDLADVGRSLRRGWKIIVASIAVGGLLALVVILFGPRRFSGSASAVVRTSADMGGSLLSRVAGEMVGGGGSSGSGSGGGGSGAGSMIGGGVSAILGGAGSPLETEIQIMQSASVLGAVIDSLNLQVEVRSPSGLPSSAFVRDVTLPNLFTRTDLQFERTAPGRFRVTGDGVDTTVASGGTVATPVGTLSLREALPPSFRLRLMDREDALKRVGRNFVVKKAGGEVLRVTFRGRDSITAAAVPNVALTDFLARKKTSDRGVNAKRAEFLAVQVDSVNVQLTQAERALRRFQERSGLLDAEVVGKLELEQMSLLRKSQGEVEVEAVALDQLLAQIAAGTMTARQLVGFPSFLRSSGINNLLQQLSGLETERTRLLERRLERDPEIVALSRSIADVEGQLIPLARSYQASLRRQRGEIASQLATMDAKLGAFPGAAEEGSRLLRDAKRLGATQTALQTQLVQARLNTVTEGGDVRGLDAATVPKKVVFPEPWLTSGVGLGAGLIVGILIALLGGSHGRYFEDQNAIERALGVPALRFDARTPLLMSGRSKLRTMLLIPTEPGVGTALVAERLAETALARGESATILDLTAPNPVVTLGASVGSMIARLEQEHGLVIARLPSLSADSTAAVLSESRPVLLVAPSRRINRRELVSALDTLRRLDVPCAGVVLSDGESRDALSR
ncbi:MAG: Wzz/FepE/Etk N-terminal domain-containing protein [Gemmatimonadaceae bacterium]